MSAQVKKDLVAQQLQRLEHHPLPVAIDLKLERMAQFLARIDNPEQKIAPIIHIAGTNGKGSVGAYVRSILKAAGLRVHAYTSPHLVHFRERIMLDGEPIGDEMLSEVLAEVLTATEEFPLTFFESTTAAAFVAFARVPADVVLLEVGLGGRLDATNVIESPAVTVITPVSIDHTEFLGDNLTAIAREKAGILKPSRPCVVGKQSAEGLQAIVASAAVVDAAIYRYAEEWRVEEGRYYSDGYADGVRLAPSLAGAHQYDNAGLACAVVEQFAQEVGCKISVDAMENGVTEATWPARMQLLDEGWYADFVQSRKDAGAEIDMWLDGGHNPAAGEVIAEWAVSRKRPLHVIIGMVKGKDSLGFLRSFVGKASSISAVRIPNEPMSADAESIAAHADVLGTEIAVCSSVEVALGNVVETISQQADVLICGSLYLAGRILEKNS